MHTQSIRLSHFLSIAAVCAGLMLSACGGGDSDDPGTVTPALAGQTFAHGEINGSDTSKLDHFAVGTLTFKVNDSAGNASGTATINGVQYALTGTVSPTDKSTTLSFSTSAASGTITGKVTDQTGFYGFNGTFDATLPVSGVSTAVRFTGYASADTVTDTGSGTSGLTGTWCADVSGNQNCWVFDSETGSSTGKFYQQSINQYAGTLTNTMTWSVDTNAKTLTYQFTRSTLSNSGYDYDEPVSQPAYTFPYTLTATTFTYQGIDFFKQ